MNRLLAHPLRIAALSLFAGTCTALYLQATEHGEPYDPTPVVQYCEYVAKDDVLALGVRAGDVLCVECPGAIDPHTKECELNSIGLYTLVDKTTKLKFDNVPLDRSSTSCILCIGKVFEAKR